MTDQTQGTPATAPDDDRAQTTGRSSTVAVLQLAGVVALATVAAAVTGALKAALVMAAVIVMILVHELGHFAVAKWSGMKVTEFFLGFGPKLWSVRRGETEYGIKAIPAGAYVRIIGMNNLEEVDAADEARTYRAQPFWQRVAVASAGSFMHFVMAFVIMFVLLGAVGTPTASTTVASLSALQGAANPAEAAGLRPGDKIVAVDSTRIEHWDQVAPALADKAGEHVMVRVERAGQETTLDIVPLVRSSVVLAGGKPVGGDLSSTASFIGVVAGQEMKTVGAWTALRQSGSQMAHAFPSVLDLLGQRFSPSGLSMYAHQLTGTLPEADKQQAADTRFVSPVGLVGFANDAARAGLASVLLLLFSINIFVGIFNLVPLLPFDGGHVAVAIYEKLRSLRGRRHVADYAKLIPVSYAVLAVLVFIGLSSLWLDVVDPAPNPFE